MKIWVDGVLGDVADARVSPMDHGLLTGDGVFETLRVYDGRPFAWTRHLDRLDRSAAALGLTVPDRAVLRAGAEAVIATNGIPEARLRITVTGGPAPLGSERGDGGPTAVIAVGAVAPFPPTASVVVVPWSRNEHGATAGLKTISYAENVRALAHAQAHGAGEAIFANTRGDLCEATGSNVFVVHAGGVRTPPAEAGPLLGVTRAITIECCAALGVPCTEAPVSLDAFRTADEAFLTSTTREVQAIGTIDGVALPGAPGPVTTRLAQAFRDRVVAGVDFV